MISSNHDPQEDKTYRCHGNSGKVWKDLEHGVMQLFGIKSILSLLQQHLFFH